MSDYSEFFLDSSSSVVQLELLDFYHPNFSKTYRIVRNAINGVTVTLEDESTHTYEYYPLRITDSGAKDTLDSSIKIDFGDLGDVLPFELDNVAASNGFGIKPIVRYRVYRSDDLSKPLLGPIVFEVKPIAFNSEGASIEATATSFNSRSTGELYRIDRFPMLRGFL